MQSIRSSLTRLRKKIEEVLSDEPDIYGYPGVDKPALISYIERCYGLTNRIEELRGDFSITILKRALAPLLDDCKDFLDNKIGSKKATEQFDQFLRNLAKIHEEIHLTYIVYCSEGIRSESELENILGDIQASKSHYETLKPQLEDALATLDQIKDLKEAVAGAEKNVAIKLAEVEKAHGRVTNLVSESTAQSQIITKYESETKEQKNDLVNLMSRLKAADTKLRKLLADGVKHTSEIESTLKSSEDVQAKNIEQQKEINNTLRLASKYGMAASFKERKDELRWSMGVWGSAFVLAMVGIFCAGYFQIIPKLIEGGDKQWIGIFVKVSLIAPLIWLGWMAAKQYGYLSRIREDYSFKYASALAFEGYKKEAADVNEELLHDLLSVATSNMSLNPLRIYGGERSNHASPLHEVFSTLADKIDMKELSEEVGGVVKSNLKSKISFLKKTNVESSE